MELLHTISENLISPPILFFVLGAFAGLLKSDLEVPESTRKYMGLYVMMAIGFKGGVALGLHTPSAELFSVLAAGLFFSFALPFIAYFLLRSTTHINAATAAAAGACYGSVSVVTFATAVSLLKLNNVDYEGYIVAVLALMEAPAVLSGLFIAHKADPRTNTHKNEEKTLAREIFTNGSILLVTGAFVIGLLTGPKGLERVSGFFELPFQGILCFFLLDMGIVVASKVQQLRKFTWSLVAFSIYMPLIGAFLGLATSIFLGLDLGTGTLLSCLLASASYIAVPSAMRLALPEAEEGIYVPLALGLSFPFNVSIGIPLYFACAKMLLAP